MFGMTSFQKGLFFASITALMFGVLAIALKIVLIYFDPVFVSWGRFVVAFIAMAIWNISLKNKKHVVDTQSIVLIIAAGTFLALNYLGFIRGVYYGGPGIAQVVIQFGPLSFALIGIVFYKEKFTLVKLFGYGLAIGGLILFYKQVFNENSDVLDVKRGVLWTFIGAISWAFYAACNKKLVGSLSVKLTNMYIFLVAAVVYIPFVDFETFFSDIPIWVYILLIVLGLITVVAYGALANAMKYIDATKISIVIILNPIITFVLIELLFVWEVAWGDFTPFSVNAYLGAILVLLGAIIAVATKEKFR